MYDGQAVHDEDALTKMECTHFVEWKQPQHAGG
jgi:hypothetical protein